MPSLTVGIKFVSLNLCNKSKLRNIYEQAKNCRNFSDGVWFNKKRKYLNYLYRMLWKFCVFEGAYSGHKSTYHDKWTLGSPQYINKCCHTSWDEDQTTLNTSPHASQKYVSYITRLGFPKTINITIFPVYMVPELQNSINWLCSKLKGYTLSFNANVQWKFRIYVLEPVLRVGNTQEKTFLNTNTQEITFLNLPPKCWLVSV